MIKKQSKILIFLLSAMLILAFMPQLAFQADAAVKPGRVTGLRIVKLTRSSVTLSWTKSKSARKYQVVCTSGSSRKTLTTKQTKATIKISTVIKCTIRVRAQNGSAFGSWSKTLTAKSSKENSKVTAAKKKVAAAQKSYNAALKAYENKDAEDFLNQNAVMKTSDWDAALNSAGGDLSSIYSADKANLKNYFTVKALLRDADLIDECNSLRAKDTVNTSGSKTPLAMNYDMMIGAAYAGLISEETGDHTVFKAGLTDDGSFAENIAWGYSDPYYGWYTQELPNYEEYLKTGSASGIYGHYKNMTGDYSSTGIANNPETATTCERFGNGSGVTPEEFRSALEQYASSEKASLDQAKAALDSAKAELARVSK
ncbi:MAG: fibronectin type III domain-containing protein [Eubacterium sp.]